MHFKSRGHECQFTEFILSHALTRTTAPSAEGAIWLVCSNFPVPQRCKGRGGSVSRRDHNQETGIRAQLTGAYSLEKKTNSNSSYSSGEGVWGRGASLREAASPPEFPHSRLFGREREGGDFSVRKVPSLAYFHVPSICSFVVLFLTIFAGAVILGTYCIQSTRFKDEAHDLWRKQQK